MPNIPQEVYDIYNEFADDFINLNFGQTCRLQYPPKRTACTNCVFDTITQRSSGVYKTGGPISFSFGICPWCNGLGYIETENTTDIKMRVYWERRYWVKINTSINIPDGSIQTIGFLYDIPKIKQAQSIIINPNLESINSWSYILASEPIPFGLTKRHFIAYWTRQ